MISYWRNSICFSDMKKYFLFFLFLNIAACGGSSGSDAGDDDDGGEALSATLSSIQENIFTPTCAISGCHSATTASGGLSLAAGEAFDGLVNTPSSQLLEMNRVEPGDPDNSYLVHKISGTQTTVGGSGTTMPQDGLALSAEEIQAITDWIEAGALDN